MKNFQILPYLFFFIMLASCSQRQDNRISPDSARITPPVMVRAGEPVKHQLNRKNLPEVIDLTTKPASDKITADFFITMKNFNTEHGLALSSIRSGFKDESGNLWFGTFGNGVSKYDGKSFTNVNMSNGLIHNYIETITQDNEGNIWFGSYGGASRYNGVHFENFTTADGLPDNHVYKILEDSRGNIWFATPGGLSLYKPDTKDAKNTKFITYDAEDGLTGSSATDILEDGKGNLWIAGIKGVFKFNPYKDTTGSPLFSDVTEITGLLNTSVYCMAEDSEGSIWFGTSEGVVSLHQENVGGKKASVLHYTIHEGLISNTITSILENRAGNMWLGSEVGVSEFVKEDSVFINYTTQNGLSDNFIVCMVEDDAGSIWLGTKASGLCRFDGKSTMEYTAMQGLPDKMIYAVAGNENNDIWIGTENGTIVKFTQKDKNKGSLVHFSTDQGLKEGDALNMIMDDDGNLWFGSDYGLSRYSDNAVITTWDTTHGLNNNTVISLQEDSKGNLWFGTFKGGVSRFDGETILNYTTEQGLVHNTVWNIYEDRSGVFWFASRGGLSRFDGENFINFTTEQGLPDNKLSVVNQDKAGNLIIGTWGGGISIIRKKWMEMLQTTNVSMEGKSIFENYNTSHGLPNDVIYGILEDDEGNIVIGSSYGFTFLKGGLGEDSEHVAKAGVENFNQQTGYPIKDISNNYTMVFDTAGIIWAGTGKKLVRFDYNEVFQNKKPPKVVIRQVNINHEKISWHTLSNSRSLEGEIAEQPNVVPAYVHDELNVYGRKLKDNERDSLIHTFRKIKFDKIKPFNAIPENLVLPFINNTISFDFLVIETARPFLVQYQYMLEGSEKKWSPLNNRTTIEYSNLRRGDYTFKLRAVGPDGMQSKETSFSFRVLPPWWFSWWAIMLYILLTIFAMISLRRYEMKRIILQNELKLEKVTTDSLRNLDQLKSNFFANISHELRTPLTLILGQIESVMSTDIGTYKKEKLEVADRNAKRLLKLINELLDLSKIESGSMKIAASKQNIVSFLKSLLFSFESLANKKTITLVFESEQDIIPVYFDPDKMEKIFNNLLSNAYKFTQNNGTITVTLSLSENKKVLIQVKDNGIGIPAERIKKIFERFYQVDGSNTRENEGTGIGLALTKELVELHKGTISVSSTEKLGTAFLIALPLDFEEIEKANKLDTTQDVMLSDSQQLDLHHKQNGELKSPGIPAVEKTRNPELVLVVEDNDDVRAYILENLVEHYNVIEARNGEEGVAMARQEMPDLVISDIMMPIMDGYQLCQAMRQDEKTSHIPIIMLTAKAGLDDKINGLETGIDSYLTKPFSARELRATIKNLILQRQQLRQRFSNATVIRPSEVSAVSTDQEFLNKIINIIETNFEDEQFSVEILANHVSMSVSQLNRKLKALVDQPPGQLIRSFRLQRAADLLAQRAGSVSEICYKVGFNDNAYFSRAFKKQFSCSPSDYSNQTA